MKNRIDMRLIVLGFAVFIMILSGCSEKGNTDNDNLTTDKNLHAADTFKKGVESGLFVLEEEDDEKIPTASYNISYPIECMEYGQEGILYLLTYDANGGSDYFMRISGDQEYKVNLEDFYNFIYYDRNSHLLYAYNCSQGYLEVRNSDFELVKVLVKDFHPFEIKEMTVHGDFLYALIVSDNPYEKEGDILFTEDDYTDYGEKLIKISTLDGAMKDTGLESIVTMCGSLKESIYLYVHREDGYRLEVLDTNSNKITYSLPINGIGYVSAMSVIGSEIYYVPFESNGSSGLCSYNIENGIRFSGIDEIEVLRQNDFDIRGRCIILLDRAKREIRCFDTQTKTVYSYGEDVESKKDEPDVVVGCTDFLNLPFSKKDLSAMTGMTIGTYVSPVIADSSFNETLMTKLLAGDSDVDIYILYNSHPYTKKISSDGVCYPLDSSDTLSKENAKYFKAISDSFLTESGSIWGIPLRITNYVIISSETELKRQGIVDEVFRDFRSMMKYLRSVEDKDRKNLCINALEYGYDLIINYETNNNPVDFGNEVFRDYMEQLWDGWIMYEEFGMANNPYMGKTDGYVFSQENSSFCMMTSSEILSRYNNADSIKLFPLPLLSDQYKQTVKVPLVAVVNPNGKNRENAIRLLESLSEYLRKTGKIGLYYKDAADYPDMVDTETSVFKQLYDINSRAVVADFGILNEICLNEIRQFQNHTIDLDTAVKSIQRKEDAYRNE